jgi:hypothetical protein
VTYVPSDTWDLVGDVFPQAVTDSHRSLRSPSTAAMYHRRQTTSSVAPSGRRGRRSWRVILQNATKAEYDRACRLWFASKGGCEGINFTTTNLAATGTESVIVRMVARPLVLSQMREGGYAFSVTLEEVLHGPA